MMMIVTPNSLVRQEERAQGEEEEEAGSRRWVGLIGTPTRSHRSDSVRGVECEEQEMTWMVVWGANPQEGQRGLGTSPILSR